MGSSDSAGLRGAQSCIDVRGGKRPTPSPKSAASRTKGSTFDAFLWGVTGNKSHDCHQKESATKVVGSADIPSRIATTTVPSLADAVRAFY